MDACQPHVGFGCDVAQRHGGDAVVGEEARGGVKNGSPDLIAFHRRAPAVAAALATSRQDARS